MGFFNLGSDEYGCHVSLEKSLCNFASQHRLPIPMTTEDQRESSATNFDM